MADEVRRSGRANKGHHTKNADALDEVVAVKPKSSKPKIDKKPKGANAASARSQSAPSVEAEEEEEGGEEIIRCVCGQTEDNPNDKREMICCDTCQAWQHNKCLHLPQGEEYWENRTYYCEQCRPEEHQELLALMEKGEKPWIKWNKKGAKPPKSRPIDVKPGSKPEKAKTATPQPSQPAAPSPATPAPTAVPTEVATDGHTVKAEFKVSRCCCREVTSSDMLQPTKPQSPLGEKRRHESSEKDGSSKKRRKPSAPKTENVAGPTGVSDINALPTKQKQVTEKLRDTLVPLITTASESRGYQIPEGQSAQSIASRLALEIDHAAFLRHGEPAGPDAPYTVQLRSIIINTKRNLGLVDQLLSGELKADHIASMSSEEMASDEKQREYAAIREANEKQMILTEETGPRFRKTHKGDELVENDAATSTHQDDFRPPPPPQNDEKPVLESPTQESHAAVELPEDVGRRESIAVDTAGGADGVRRPSMNFDINSVFAQVRSPQNEQHSFLQRRQSSIQQPEKNTQVDADVDRLLKDEDGDVDMSAFADETIVWRGSIEMQHMESCASVARFVAGGDFGKAIPWTKLLSSTLPIAGRIEEARGDEYIRGLATTGSHDVAVLSLSPVSSEGRTVMDTLYKYFHDRNRWGVIPVDKLDHEAMRDLYVIPIPAGPSNLPQFMDLLEYCTIETPRKDDMLVLALVAKLPDIQPQSVLYPQHDTSLNHTPTPAQPSNGASGPSPSPLTNPHGPSYSPVGPSFPPNPYLAQPNNGYSPTPPQAAPPQAAPPQAPESAPFNAADILGPYMASPVVQELLQNPHTRDTLYNLKDLLDKVPAAQYDINVLSQCLYQKNAMAAAANGNFN
ncbi:Transcription factor bye1 [Paraconiothyrium brasiliense]|uniref:Transcription factor BYE1 n=1 Tax=Paraconiothyrium brasiliense TaxID=300254 RepID=A0ABR3S0L2_9PLEO